MADESNDNQDRNDRSSTDSSLFRVYALGHAAEDREKNSRLLKVFLSEINSTADGEMGFSGANTEASGKDVNGKQVDTSMRSENSIDCEWLQMGANRATPPDIVKGETVLIYRYGDDNKYYWKETGINQKFRKLETVTYTFGANPDGAGEDPNNYYIVEVSADRKLITIQTTKANGEPYAITTQINTGDGNFHMKDDIGNQFEIDFADNHFRMENADGSYVDMTHDHIEAKNQTGSNVDIEGDKIFARNSSGSEISIEGDHIRSQNVTGSFVDLQGGNVEANGTTLLKLTGGGTTMLLTAAGIAVSKGG